MKTNVNQRVKLLRKALVLSQSEFAAELGVSASIISKVESEEQEPTPKLLSRVMDHFHVNGEWLIYGKGELSFVKPEKKAASDPWKDITYKELKENNSYLQRKLDEATLMLSRFIERGSLGKFSALYYTGTRNRSVKSIGSH